MANTYYNSTLTGDQIDNALKAIDGVIVPANNGKVLAINNGKIEARSVQWGGGSTVLEPLSVTENGDYMPEAGVDGFDEVHVSVPNSYTASDEGKVVNNGALVAQTARTSQITQNGTYDTTLNDEVTVNVSGGGSAVVQPLSVTQNGTYNPPSGVDGYSTVTVNVPSSLVTPLKYLTNCNYYVGSSYEYYYGSAIETVASFELEIGEHYILSVGSPAPDRFRRVMFDSEPFTQIPAVIPGPTSQVELQNGADVGGSPPTEDPPAYSAVPFQATKRYLGVHLSRVPDTSPSVYLFKL